MTDDASHQFENQVVVFVDLLGTSDRATRGQQNRKAKLLDLLRKIAAMKADFFLDGRSHEDGSFRLRIAPAVSTFSDCMVLSFPVPKYDLEGADAEFMEKLYLEVVLKQTRNIVGTLALDALKIGMLVRGGMTSGGLFHQQGVVLGQGLIDAYDLESKVSKYPRVTISSDIYSCIHPNDRRPHMRLDKDGIWHLDYFRNLNLEMSRDAVLAREISDSIDLNIRAHEQAQNWNEYAKWYWCRSELAEARREDPNPEPETNELRMPTGYEAR